MSAWKRFGGTIVFDLLRRLTARLRSTLDSLRGSYWLVPSVMAVISGALGFGVVELDRLVGDALLQRTPWIRPTGADGSRAVLSVIAGSMITVTGVVFSIVVVALTLASSQFGPRLLRNFLRDRANQVAFGTFVATFLYALVVLRSVRPTEVPQIATALGVVLATVSLFVLIYFIHHIATSIEASSVIAAVADELDTQIPKLFPTGLRETEAPMTSVDEALERLAADGATVFASASGFVRVVDEHSVLSLATERDLIVALHRRPGDFVAAGMSLASVGPVAGATDEVRSAIRGAFVLGNHRTPVQDIAFLIGQLTEIAVRALSPGVNDPRTARDCVSRIGAVLCAVGDREMPSRARSDAEGELRVIAPHTTFEGIVSACLDPIRQYGGTDVSIVAAVLETIGAVSECCPDERRREILAHHAQAIYEVFEASEGHSGRDLVRVKSALAVAASQLDLRKPEDP